MQHRMAQDFDDIACDLENGAVDVRHPGLMPQRGGDPGARIAKRRGVRGRTAPAPLPRCPTARIVFSWSRRAASFEPIRPPGLAALVGKPGLDNGTIGLGAGFAQEALPTAGAQPWWQERVLTGLSSQIRE
jgi:hypothetical protein